MTGAFASLPNQPTENPNAGFNLGNWWTTLDGVLSHPVRQFNQLAATQPTVKQLGWACAWVVVVTMLAPLMLVHTPFGIMLTLFFGAIGGVFSWLAMAGAVALWAYCAGWQGSVKTFLLLSAWSLAPWVLTPALLLGQQSQWWPVALLAVLTHLLVWYWSAALWCLALTTTYKLSWLRLLGMLAFALLAGWLVWGVLFNGLGHVGLLLR
jgi:hypothetical protein